MKELLLSGKKGVSEMVGYVILIVIALSLSVFVYAYLKLYVPKGSVECSSDINLALQDYKCISNNLEITLVNKGLFRVNGVYVRFDEESKKIREQILDQNEASFYLGGGKGLLPGESEKRNFNVASIITRSSAGANYTLEIQPAIYDSKNRWIACNNAVVLQKVECK